ncbi:MAG: HD domain-containing protein [Anaerolineae bacterium]|nr:HD domain-containing protein [Anaerolineae bacterium]
MLTIDEACILYEEADSAHDFSHVLRVLALAEHLAEQECADLSIVRTAALLHDLARAEDMEKGLDADRETDHAIIAAAEARRILSGQSEEIVEAVAHAIEAHRFRNGIEPKTIEAKVLFDADKLDAIGAVGTARAFAYGGRHGQPLWADVSENYVPGGDESHTAHHEFHVKLKNVKDRLYTESGRRIAAQRHQFMCAFFEQMAAEVRGER